MNDRSRKPTARTEPDDVLPVTLTIGHGRNRKVRQKKMGTERGFRAVRPPHVVTKWTHYCHCLIHDICQEREKNKA